MPRPPLKFLHDPKLLNPVKLNAIELLSTEQILRSLKLDNGESLKVRPDGTVLDGHHRLFVLRKRGVEVDALPREVLEREDLDEIN